MITVVVSHGATDSSTIEIDDAKKIVIIKDGDRFPLTLAGSAKVYAALKTMSHEVARALEESFSS